MNATRTSMVVAIALLAAGSSGALAQGAAGLEPGVHVDPGSPAAKEYALPLSQGRQTGGGATSSAGPETPFGAGIKPPRSGGPGSRSGGAGGSSRSGGAGGSSRSRGAGAGTPGNQPVGRARPGSQGVQASSVLLPPAVRQAEDTSSSGGTGSLAVLIGGGVAILVIGGFGGTVLRHSRRPTPSR
jgi:hypothetical protein